MRICDELLKLISSVLRGERDGGGEKARCVVGNTMLQHFIF
ncbi:hypothetical protein WG66_011019 [Moniliophthora roreri]|nr:hypothetical protein WG66_011019 [Moniliophthora roreri]